MTIRIKCPSCGKKLGVPEESMGKKARCPGCRKVFRLNGSGTLNVGTNQRLPGTDSSVVKQKSRYPTDRSVPDNLQDVSHESITHPAVRSRAESIDHLVGSIPTSPSPVGSAPPPLPPASGTKLRLARPIHLTRRTAYVLAGVCAACLVAVTVYWISTGGTASHYPEGMSEKDVARAFAGVYEHNCEGGLQGLHGRQQGVYREFYVYNPDCGFDGVYYVVDVVKNTVADCGVWRFGQFRAATTVIGPQYVVLLELLSRDDSSSDDNQPGFQGRATEIVVYMDRYRPVETTGSDARTGTIPDVVKSDEVDDQMLEPVEVLACGNADNAQVAMTCYRLREFPNVVARTVISDE